MSALLKLFISLSSKGRAEIILISNLGLPVGLVCVADSLAFGCGFGCSLAIDEVVALGLEICSFNFSSGLECCVASAVVETDEPVAPVDAGDDLGGGGREG